MKKTVWTFGLISGAVMAGMFFSLLPFHDQIGYDNSVVLGYTTMIAAFLLVFFGIRSYRENVGGGVIGFGRAMAVGSLIVAVASSCYVAAWEVYFYGGNGGTEYIAKYQELTLAKQRATGATQAQLDKTAADNQKFAELYRNPVVNIGLTFLEPLPVGVLIALVSAGVLSRKKRAMA